MITPSQADYTGTDINVQMTLNGNTLSSIKNNGTALVNGTDYAVDGEKVTLKQSYLDTLAKGQSTALVFDFSNGKSQTFTVKTAQAVENGLIINIADVEGKAGETITIPLTITGIDPAEGLNGCNFNLKYDTDIFENVTVTPGDILVNPNKTLFKVVNKTSGAIGIMYADSTGEELEAIMKDGLFVNINLKVKDDVKNATSQLQVTKEGKFVDKASNAYTINYKVGKITIGDGTQIDVPVIIDSTLSKTSADYDKNDPSAIEVGMVLNGNKLASIKNGDKVLAEGTDYTVNGSVVTINTEYLSSLSEGDNKLTFTFNNGADAELNINVTNKKVVEEGIVAGIAQIEGKAGQTITLPVTLSKVPEQGISDFSYKIKYDANLIDVLGVEAGDSITNPEVNFSSDVYSNGDSNIVSVLFIDNALSDEELIKNAGTLMNIKLKVKDNAPAGSIPIKFNDGDNSFYDMNGNKIDVKFSDGSIDVK